MSSNNDLGNKETIVFSILIIGLVCLFLSIPTYCILKPLEIKLIDSCQSICGIKMVRNYEYDLETKKVKCECK